MFRRFGQGAAQLIGQRQFVQQVGFESGQALPQILQRMQLALDLGFALLAGEVVEVFRHGGGPVENADMIAAAAGGKLQDRSGPGCFSRLAADFFNWSGYE